MVAIFTLAFVLVVGGAVWTTRHLLVGPRTPARLALCLPLLLVYGVLLAYLLAKLVYEEIYPCVAVDDRYRDFASTQYRNLFGWEF